MVKSSHSVILERTIVGGCLISACIIAKKGPGLIGTVISEARDIGTM